MADSWPNPADFAPTGKKEEDEKKREDFIAALAKCWADDTKALSILDHDHDWDDIKGKLKGATPEDVAGHLRNTYKKDTGAFAKLKGPKLDMAWMVARVEEYKYHHAGWKRYGAPWPSFKTAPEYARDTAEVPEECRQKGTRKIAPGLATFLSAVYKVFKPFEASNYDGHSTVGSKNQGLSVDIYLHKWTSDKLWFDVAEATKFLKAVDATAVSKDFAGTKWMALYDHYDLAAEINGKVKQGAVRFRASGGTYHGPAPAKLHIHLEVVVPSDKDAPKKAE